MSSLRLDWANHAAADYACKNWHYSGKMPAGKSVKVGVWENDKFIGVVVFSRGANNNIGTPYGLTQLEVCELTRVALNGHSAPVSKIVSVALRLMRKHCPGLRLIISYADPVQNHHGGIYQAMGWVYGGSSRPQRAVRVAGVFLHKRAASSRWGTASPEKIRQMTGLSVEYGPAEWKHTYYLPLDDGMRQQVKPLAKPYPKRPEQTRERSAEGGTAGHTAGGDSTLPVRSNLEAADLEAAELIEHGTI